jgi:choline dehydrogenase-like flavoprotein
LGIKERPVKADNHAASSKWTDSDFAILADGIRKGDSYCQIGRLLGKSEKAVRGKAYFVYLTEDADKIRAMMGDQPWGYGAPEPTVKQAVVLSRTRSETKDLLEQLCGVLCRRTVELKKTDYDHYFQRAQCMNWNDLDSRCEAGCDDCDGCSEFVRIRPQYCVRCGATFYERQENIRCKQCRTDRKRMAARKYMALSGR